MAGVEDRVALVTGAGRGIGRVAAELLASRGAKVMCVSRTESELESVGLEYVAADLGSDVLQYRLDGNYTEYIEIPPESMPKIMLQVEEEYNKTKSLLLGERGTEK